MTRHFSTIRDDIKSLEENINCIAEKTLQVLEQRNVLSLNEEVAENSKESPNEAHTQANMRALRKIIVFL